MYNKNIYDIFYLHISYLREKKYQQIINDNNSNTALTQKVDINSKYIYYVFINMYT